MDGASKVLPIEGDDASVNILVVHEDAAVRRRIDAALRARPGAVRVGLASDAGAAIDLLDERSFDCVLAGHGIPPDGGIDLLRRIRRRAAGPGPAVVVVAPRVDTAALRAAIEAGAQGVLFADEADPQVVRGAVEVALARQKRESERREILAALGQTNLQLTESNRALQESEQRFRGVFQTAPHGMALVAPDGRWLGVNPALCNMLGYTEEELIALTFQDITHPDDLDADLAYVEQMLAGEIPFYRMEKRYIRKDGEQIWILLSVSLVRDADGKPLHFVSEILDLTDIKRAQQDLQRVHRLEAIGQLTGGIAHDFNNLLMAMQLNLEVLNDRLAADPEGLGAVRMLEGALERGTELTRRLLQFARRQPLQPKVVDVNGLLGEAVTFIRRTLREDIEIISSLAADLWPCEIDPGQFQNAIVNLAVNASDAMPAGGTLSVETANIRVETRRDGPEPMEAGDYVRIVLRDTGVGMPQSVVERVFEPFFTTKDVGKGTGLGLSMVYGFVKQSGGHIRLHSQPDSGTTVRIHLPRAVRDEVAGGDEADEAPVASTGLERILVVEDSDDVRRTLAAMLRKEGYQVEAAATGREAIGIVDHAGFRPQMLIADVVLPERITGREVAEAVLLRVPDCRVLFMSGYAENVLVHDGRVDPGMVLLTKPFTKRTLLAKIGELLERPGFG
ncbi:MAG: PAS domain S-box protein [Alphaproteobacteria bacterium]|nr:PAS domain S-box protein [Alphaproteobacteria bacterium]